MPIELNMFETGRTMKPDEVFTRKGTGKKYNENKKKDGGGPKDTCPWCDKLITGLYDHLKDTCTSVYIMWRFDRLPNEYNEGRKIAWKPEWERQIAQIEQMDRMLKQYGDKISGAPTCSVCKNIMGIVEEKTDGLLWQCPSCKFKVLEKTDNVRYDMKGEVYVEPKQPEPKDKMRFAEAKETVVEVVDHSPKWMRMDKNQTLERLKKEVSYKKIVKGVSTKKSEVKECNPSIRLWTKRAKDKGATKQELKEALKWL